MVNKAGREWRACRLAAGLIAAASQAACPAYLISGVGTERGRQRAALPSDERDARLRCQGKECTAIDVSRSFTVAHNPAAYWVVLAAEFLGSGIAFSDLVKVAGESHDGSVPGSTSTKQTMLLGAGLLAAGLGIADIVYGVSGYSQGQFSPRYDPFRFDARYNMATWNGMTVPLALDDVVPAGALEMPKSFSVRDAAERRGMAPGRVQAATSGQLAVLDFKNTVPSFSIEDVRYFTDVVRSVALKQAPSFGVITRENLLVLLQSSGKGDLAQCEGECEVETARRIGADVVVSGDIHALGGSFKLSLRMHDTRAGRLIAAAQAEGRDVGELDQNLTKAATELLGVLGAAQ